MEYQKGLHAENRTKMQLVTEEGESWNQSKGPTEGVDWCLLARGSQGKNLKGPGLRTEQPSGGVKTYLKLGL